MSMGISARLLKHPTAKKQQHELIKSHSQSQVLASKLREEGVRMGTVENVMQTVDQVVALLMSSQSDPTISYNIMQLCQSLKVYGAYLELLYEDQLNRAFVVFRNSSLDEERLDYTSRFALLELIELRAKRWKVTSDSIDAYYRQKANHCAQIEAAESASSLSESINSLPATILGPGELLKPSGKFAKPTRIAGKNYCKDEVVIRNVDSGKVMGIKGRRVHMIEELSETIISFQRVNPGAKERLVQITGSNEESINHARHLMEDTIRRNASPIRQPGAVLNAGSSSSINSSASDDSMLPAAIRGANPLVHSLSANDAGNGQYKYSVVVGDHVIRIIGDHLDLVKICKLVLDDYFCAENLELQQCGSSIDGGVFPEFPISPPNSTPSPGLPNGNNSDEPALLRRPHMPKEEIIKRKPSVPLIPIATTHAYSPEYLARLANSPLCLADPPEWNTIITELPLIVRKEVKCFDVDKYLAESKEVIQNEDEV